MAKQWRVIKSGHRVQGPDPVFYRALVETVAAGERTLMVEGRVDNLGSRGRNMPRLPGLLTGDHRGHLIPLRFGGPDVRENLIPMLGRVNLSPYTIMENEIARMLGDRRGEMQVTIVYTDSTGFRPRHINARVQVLHLGPNARPASHTARNWSFHNL
jgi:hypothetical protein